MPSEEAKKMSNDLLTGVATTTCPDMKELVDKVKMGEMPKEDLIDVVDTSLIEQEKMEKLKSYVL